MSTKPLSTIINDVRTKAGLVAEQTRAAIKTQIKKDGRRIAAGSGMMVAALASVFVIPPLLIAALVLGLVTMGLWPWAACLIVAAAALLLTVGLALAAVAVLMRVGKSAGQTMAQVKDSFAALNGTVQPPAED